MGVDRVESGGCVRTGLKDRNCRNCGAPVKPGEVCEYCGTLRAEEVSSRLSITATGITLVCEKIGRLPEKNPILYADNKIAELGT